MILLNKENFIQWKVFSINLTLDIMAAKLCGMAVRCQLKTSCRELLPNSTRCFNTKSVSMILNYRQRSESCIICWVSSIFKIEWILVPENPVPDLGNECWEVFLWSRKRPRHSLHVSSRLQKRTDQIKKVRVVCKNISFGSFDFDNWHMAAKFYPLPPFISLNSF